MSDPQGLVNLRAVVEAYYGCEGRLPLDMEALAGMLADWEADRERLRDALQVLGEVRDMTHAAEARCSRA